MVPLNLSDREFPYIKTFINCYFSSFKFSFHVSVVIVAIFTSKPRFDFNSIVAREIHVLGTIGYTRKDVENGVDLISTGKVLTVPLVSNVVGLDQVVNVGFAQMLAQTKNVFRIVVDPSI